MTHIWYENLSALEKWPPHKLCDITNRCYQYLIDQLSEHKLCKFRTRRRVWTYCMDFAGTRSYPPNSQPEKKIHSLLQSKSTQPVVLFALQYFSLAGQSPPISSIHWGFGSNSWKRDNIIETKPLIGQNYREYIICAEFWPPRNFVDWPRRQDWG